MKNIVLASALGTLAGAFAVPAIGGPVHYQITRPYSMFGLVPANLNSPLPVSVTLGTAPLDFILTDVMLGGFGYSAVVTVNGAPILSLGVNAGSLQGDAHMTSGVFIPAGSVIGVEAVTGQANPTPVTLAGYVQ